MGIFDLFRPDLSSEWPEESEQLLTLDLRDMALNGLRLGAAAEQLARFGRPSNRRPFRSGSFLYERMGVVVEIEEDGRVDYFGLPFVRREVDPVGPCRGGVVLPDGARIDVTSGTPVDALRPHLPEPESVDDEDDDETVYVFRLDDRTLELEASPEGNVYRVNLFQT